MNINLGIPSENLLDSMNTGVVLIGNDFMIRHMNTASELMLGVSRAMSKDKNIFDTFPCTSKIERQIRMARDNQRIYSERDMEINIGRHHRIVIDCVISPMLTDNLDSDYLILELHQVDRRLRISREDHLLSQGEGTRGLLRGVAHEIKNPLGGIRGAAQLLASELPDPQYTEYTDVITHEVDRLQNLLDRMLGPRQLPQLETLNIHQILEQVRKLVDVDNAHNTRVMTDYDPSLPDVCVDMDMMQQALLNLIRNAIQATSDVGSGEVLIRTRPERQFTIGHIKHRLVIKIEIIDDGNGVPEEMAETMFLPMITDKKEGTGLGLPIAQTLVQRHGGLIEYETCDGKTCFIVYLPIGNENDARE